MQRSMGLISPIMTGFISFSVPAGLGLYWIISNILQIFQQMFMNKYIIKKNSSTGKKPLYEPAE
jgi:YidC/Oxa1 family membrane protein insertase